MTFDQDSITVSGEQLAVANISHALVTVDISGATESFSTVSEFQLIDYNGEVIENSTFRTSVETVEVNVPILMIKELPLEIDFTESPGSTLEDVVVDIDPKAITVSGDSRSIGRLERVVLTEIDLSKLTGDTSFTVPIPVPSGSTSVSGETEATVSIQFKDSVATQVFEASNISYVNEPEDSTVTVVSNALEVTLRGPAAELADVTDHNIRVVGDLTDISAERRQLHCAGLRLCGWGGACGGHRLLSDHRPDRRLGRYDTDGNCRTSTGRRTCPPRRGKADRLRPRL